MTIEDYVAGVNSCLGEMSTASVEGVVKAICTAFQKHKKLFVCGNGGSASMSSHFVSDLGKGMVGDSQIRLPVLSLADNMDLVTAIANDISFAAVFKEQLVSLLSEGDVVIGISGSGNSPNILEAIEYAKSKGARTIGLCGFGGGKLAKAAELAIVVSSKDYGQIQDAHMIFLHFLSQEVRRRLAPAKR